MAQPKTPSDGLIGHREGARWINRRPEGEEVASWFAQNVRMHEGLAHADYVGGIVLIGSTDKQKVAKQAAGGTTQFIDEERYAWTPYTKVETRVQYFWDLMELHPEWVGSIEPVEMPRLGDPGVYNLNLPPGFYAHPVALPDGKFARYVACAMRVVVYRADTLEWHIVTFEHGHADGGKNIEERAVLRGIPVAIYPSATKMVSTLGQYGKEDPFALMKAETGAVGRALGMAGMLVPPGSGIATAEDMHEAQAGATGVGLGEAAALPAASLPPGTEEVDVRDAIRQKLEALAAVPDAYARLVDWAKERKIDLDNPKETQLRGLLVQLNRLAAP